MLNFKEIIEILQSSISSLADTCMSILRTFLLRLRAFSIQIVKYKKIKLCKVVYCQYAYFPVTTVFQHRSIMSDE